MAQKKTKTFEEQPYYDPFEGFFSSEAARPVERTEPTRILRTEHLFNRTETLEQQKIRTELHEMVEVVRKELSMLKLQDKALTEEVSKLVLQEIPEKPGLYHIRFYEFVVKMLRLLRERISEGRLWLNASFEKKRKKKYWNLAKSKGTSFSRSNELTQANMPG